MSGTVLTERDRADARDLIATLRTWGEPDCARIVARLLEVADQPRLLEPAAPVPTRADTRPPFAGRTRLIYDHIRAALDARRPAPTLHEIGTDLRLGLAVLHDEIDWLVAAGYLTRGFRRQLSLVPPILR